jgi:predicted RecB family nuclease
MQITDEIFKSYLSCQYKAHLKLCGKTGNKTELENLNDELRKAREIEVIQQFLNEYYPADILQSPLLRISDLKKSKKVILTPHLEIDNISISLFALEKLPKPSKLGSFSYVPIILSENKKITKAIRLLLTFQAVCLEKLQGTNPHIGKIVFGGSKRRSIIKLDPYYREVQKLLQAIQKQHTNKVVPKFMLNKHCEMCEFNEHCHQKAVKEDDLSLLSGIRPREILLLNNKGIFTVKNYSYTFRARKKRKRVKDQKTPHFSSLKALAIREKKIYIYEKPQLPDARVRIYLDIEGDPDQSFEYLIGVLVADNNSTKLYSYWADTQEEEKTIFNQLFSVIAQYEDYSIFHYGNYERKRIEKIIKRFDDLNTGNVFENLIDVFSIIHSNIYVPTYSNKLKDLAKYLGFQWTDNDASGLQSIAWRRKWEVTKDKNFKQRLLTYNHEDCQALKKVTEFVYQIILNLENENLDAFGLEYAQNTKSTKEYHFQKQTFAFPDLEYINQCAYFDYQREKIFIRTNKYLRKAQRKQKRTIKKIHKINEKRLVKMNACPNCGNETLLSVEYRPRKNVFDFKFYQSGMRKWIIQYSTFSYKCKQCGQNHIPPKYKHLELYGRGLASWCIYQYVANRMTHNQIIQSLFDIFDYHFSMAEIYRLKSRTCQFYQETYQTILDKLLHGNILHADETEIKLKKYKGYVWVFSNMEEVIYMYQPTREGDFLEELLENFHGILISDFYPAYDSINCLQQKCLVHLIRDLNTDLLLNPFDNEYKLMVKDFTILLRKIIDTIDKFGLKKRHLHKHIKDKNNFFSQILKSDYESELAAKYQMRFKKNSDKLFTFLEYDNVPWNNNNAENAIKPFAKYRVNVSGQVAESGIKDYLIVLSIYQTCKYKNSNFFDFLISGKTDIYNFFDSFKRPF